MSNLRAERRRTASFGTTGTVDKVRGLWGQWAGWCELFWGRLGDSRHHLTLGLGSGRGRPLLKGRRAFRPGLGGASPSLEPRLVMSHTPFALSTFLLSHPNSKVAQAYNDPQQLSRAAPRFYHQVNYNKGYVNVQTARGGAAAVVAAPDGSHFRVSIQQADNTYSTGLTTQNGGSGTNVIPSPKVQPIGTVRAYPTPGGSVGLIIDGTTSASQLEVDPLPFPQRKGYAHSFAYGESGVSHVLNISSINVTSGQIGGILGYKDANLSGPLVIGGTTTVDRIAFNALLPGASIGVGGSVNTLDVNGDINLSTGPGISIGGDLNLLNVGGDTLLTNGASLIVHRFIGLVPQPPKGTDTGSNILSLNQSEIGTGTSATIPSVSTNFLGNVTVGPGSSIFIGSGIAQSSVVQSATSSSLIAAPTVFLVDGTLNLNSASQLQIPGYKDGDALTTFITVTQPNPTPPPATISQTESFNNSLIHRNGLFVNGVRVSSLTNFFTTS